MSIHYLCICGELTKIIIQPISNTSPLLMGVCWPSGRDLDPGARGRGVQD